MDGWTIVEIIKKILMAVVVIAFGYLCYMHPGRSIHDRSLDKKEREFLDLIEIVSWVGVGAILYTISQF